jgi:hypothetical protein
VKFLDADQFTAERPWGALDIAEIDHATVRLHWTDQPYVWHVAKETGSKSTPIMAWPTVSTYFRSD